MRVPVFFLILSILGLLFGGAPLRAQSLTPTDLQLRLDLEEKFKAANQQTENNPSLAIEQFTPILKLAREKQWFDLERKTSAHIAMSYSSLELIEKAKDIAQPYLSLANREEDLDSLVKFYRVSLQYYDTQNDKQNIASYRQQLSDLLVKTKDGKVRSQIYDALANSHVDAREYPKAFDYLKQALGEAEAAGDEEMIEGINNEIAIIYDNTGEHSKAIEYFSKSLSFAQKGQRSFYASIYLYNLGTSYKSLDDCASAIRYFQDALALSEKLADEAGIAESYFQIGTCYRHLKQIDQAKKALQLAIDISRHLDKDWLLFQATHSLIEIYLELGKTQKAQELFLLQKAYVDKISHPRISEKYHHLGMEIASQKKQFDLAFFHAKEYITAHDLMRDTAQDENLNQLKVQFDAEQKEIENNLLRSDNELKKLTIANQKKQNLALLLAISLSLLVVLSIGYLLRAQIKLRKLVQSKERKMSKIVKHINSGIVVLDRQGIIAPLFSPAAASILGHSQLAGLSIFTLLEQKSAKLKFDEVKNGFEMVFGMDEIAFELNSYLFFQECEIFDEGKIKHLAFHWATLTDAQDCIESLLLTISDITQIDELRSEEQKQVEQSKLVTVIMSVGYRRLQRWGVEFSRELLEIRQALVEQLELPRIKRDLHTHKGNLRTLGFTELASLVHHMEQVLLDRGLAASSDLLSLLDQLQTQTQAFLSQATALEAKINEGNDSQTHFHLHSLLARWQQQGKLAATLADKPSPDLVLTGETNSWPVYLQAAIENIMGHLINNSMAHGIESKAERSQWQKPEAGKISVEAVTQGNSWLLRVYDDGKGLDLMHLERIAKQRSWLKPEAQPSAEELANLILRDEFSTASSISEIAGRGVGLAAVRQEIETLGGRLTLELGEKNAQGRIPLGFRIEFPRNTLTQLPNLSERRSKSA